MLLPAKPKHLLFVDDEPHVLQAINRSLHGVDASWILRFASSVDAALTCLHESQVDVVVSDVTMPQRDGFDLMHAIAQSPVFKSTPVIMLTGLSDANVKRRALDAGAFDLIAKPIAREDLIARIRSVLRTKDYQDSLSTLNATLEQQVLARTRDLEASRTDILICLALAGECRDTDTGRHVLRVAQYARRLAEKLGLPTEEIEKIFRAAPLHDIGKLGIPDRILLKPGPLTDDEHAMMQTHCEMGHRILTTPTAGFFDSGQSERPINPLLNSAAEIALTHHERWDGTGYPHQIAGDMIPLSGRIVAVADVYDALATQRPYKDAMSHANAIELQRQQAGTHFDPQIIAAQQDIADDFDAIRRAGCDRDGAQANSIAAFGSVFTPIKRSA